MRAIIAAGALVLLSSTAMAQVELKNDGFDTGETVAFQAGFCPTEFAASRLIAPESGRQLLRVRFLFGPDDSTPRTVTIKVWNDTAGDTPGSEIYSNDFSVVGSSSAFFEADVSADNIILPQQFRVGVGPQHEGPPAVAADIDGINAASNYLYWFLPTGPNCAGGPANTWNRSQTLGLSGDWIIRVDVSNGGGPLPDAAPGTPDAAPGTPDAATGGGCNGNTECSVGQYCDTANHVCTFDCIEDTDCGGSMACSSLGQCVEGSGGGGCQTDPRSGPGGLVVLCGLGVLTLIVRRRSR